MSASNQVKFQFDKLTEAGLKPLIKKFAKHQCPVTEVESSNRAKRESGSLVKSFILTFEDGQKMTVRVKADGTVFQVKLNKKVVPIKNVDNMDKAIIEMANYVYDNAKGYAKAKAQREKKKLVPKKPPITTSRKEKISAAKLELEQVNGNVESLNQQVVELSSVWESKGVELSEAEKALSAEQKKTKALEAAIEAATKGLQEQD